MPDFFTVGKSAVYVGATTDNPRTIHKNSGGALHFKDSRDVDLNDPELSVGLPLTADKGHWLVAEDSTSVMVEEESAPSATR